MMTSFRNVTASIFSIGSLNVLHVDMRFFSADNFVIDLPFLVVSQMLLDELRVSRFYGLKFRISYSERCKASTRPVGGSSFGSKTRRGIYLIRRYAKCGPQIVSQVICFFRTDTVFVRPSLFAIILVIFSGRIESVRNQYQRTKVYILLAIQ